MSRLRNIPETCPIYKDAEHMFATLKNEIEGGISDGEVSEYLGDRFIDYAKSILECVDICRDISGDLRGISVERAEKIEELERNIEALISV